MLKKLLSTMEIIFRKTKSINTPSSYEEFQVQMEKFTLSSPFIPNSVTQVADGNMETYIIQQFK